MINTSKKYPPHKKTSLLWVCRKCHTERLKKYRKENPQKIYEIVQRSIKKHQHKQNARIKVRNALLSGKLIRPTVCTVCDKEGSIEGHHEDYSKPLDVVWVCRPCHKILDRTVDNPIVKTI